MGRDKSFTLQANGQLEHAAQYRPLIIAYRNGAPVRLDDVAKVVDSVENDQTASWLDGRPSILLAVKRQPNANTVQVVDAVKALVPMFEAQLPASIQLHVLLDRSVSIRNSVNEVQFTLMLTAVLVVLVIFVFLRNVTATVIPALALPVSVIGTFAGMELLGYSVDNLSLMALTLSVGFVVDDAIVMPREHRAPHRERRARHRRRLPRLARNRLHHRVDHAVARRRVHSCPVHGRRRRPRLPRVRGDDQHDHPHFGLRLAHPDADAVLAAPEAGAPRHPAQYLLSRGGRRLQRALPRLSPRLDPCHALAPRDAFLTLLSIAASGYLFAIVPKGFFPIEDTGQIVGFTEAAQDTSFDAMAAHQLAVVKIIKADPNVADVNAAIGAVNSSPSLNTGRLFIQLKPRDQRPLRPTR